MSTQRFYSGQITQLNDDEVFVFGANPQGFHGAGSAGYATFGEHGNVWRKHDYHLWPNGTLGRWNVKGKIGPQRGYAGASYGLVTVSRAGAKRSHRPDFRSLFMCCAQYPHRVFYLAQTDRVGLNGWTGAEMVNFMTEIGPRPHNLIIHESLRKYIPTPQENQVT